MHTAPRRLRWRRATRVVVLVALALGTVVPAAPASAADRMKVRDVTIDCAGDVVAGHVTMTNAAVGTMTADLYVSDSSTKSSKMTKIASRTVKTGDWMNEVAYSFSLARHWKYYRVKATIGRSSRFSAAVGDPTCAPPAQVSEAGVAGLVVLVMGAAAGGVLLVRRRRDVRAGTAVA